MWFLLVCVVAAFLRVEGAGAGAARLVCYVGNAADFAECTHLVYDGDARGDKLDTLLKEYRKNNPRLKILVRTSEGDKVNIVLSFFFSLYCLEGCGIFLIKNTHRYILKKYVKRCNDMIFQQLEKN